MQVYIDAKRYSNFKPCDVVAFVSECEEVRVISRIQGKELRMIMKHPDFTTLRIEWE